MEIGPLSEWVTAIAEIAAVCVALFLPYFEKVREKRKNNRNMKLIFKKLIEGSLRDNNTKSLESYFKIAYLASDDENDQQLLSVVRHAIEIIKDDKMSSSQKNDAIQEILAFLSE
ncbi:hypothetical protein SAMN04487792_1468 [Lactobacillus bombicola]|uniref:Uncharacterized protein n=1 Tax=Lactobacillus bombicola TaxID=1505723 RepID=A0A1I1TJI5_9LACO|nr:MULTISPECIES: hypothetical protein [Lactobacillus]MCO6528329.1 hypothetical protein [Lactobacillus sp.]RMC42770.1 hypothetical protein F5ESL0233_00840 [Lactobacillus sp. ESL0233]SFD58729.1 hypothetical protein SAMN04487792_1468 [Lactobacillus bombicola]